MRVRRGVRAVMLDDDRILLCRMRIAPPGTAVWITPGGGVEDGESPLEALRRELLGDRFRARRRLPPHVWRRAAPAPPELTSHDAVADDFYLVRTTAFTPRGTFSDEAPAAENITGFRWWALEEIAGYRGPDLFAPRDLATPLRTLIEAGAPAKPVPVGGSAR
ncbi:NUDIX domain-containing protein [Amycolatopsis methanolica]|uniref:NUDIX domain-containing protein n=1 Tax=Amycolatopsis methanolica TaxID=1814 RepID=UPI0034296C91